MTAINDTCYRKLDRITAPANSNLAPYLQIFHLLRSYYTSRSHTLEQVVLCARNGWSYNDGRTYLRRSHFSVRNRNSFPRRNQLLGKLRCASCMEAGGSKTNRLPGRAVSCSDVIAYVKSKLANRYILPFQFSDYSLIKWKKCIWNTARCF